MSLKNKFSDKNGIIILVFIILINLFSLNIISAKSQAILINYNNLNDSYEYRNIDFSTILLQVVTPSESNCRYNVNNPQLYKDMTKSFNFNPGKFHEKSYENLQDGVYKYYIRCYPTNSSNESEPTQLELDLRVNSLVNAKIVLSKDSPLNSGKIDLNLVTSKLVSEQPTLSYSYDGIVYNKIPLFGFEKNWKSYLIIPKDLGESVLSFKFSGIDLEGRAGDEIMQGNVFLIDTIRPKTIYDFKAVGYDGEIRLDWYYDDIAKSFNIYRSTNPNPDFTNFYKNVDKNPFSDLFVEKGKTYYYRITALDDAGNEADLSREVSATALLSNYTTQTNSGLDVQFLGTVDNLLSELDSLKDDIDGVLSTISGKQEKEKRLFTILKLDKEIENVKIELNSLRKDIEKFKTQDLSKEELDKKLDSSRLKLDIIKKKVPENIILSKQESRKEDITNQDIQELILEVQPDITDNLKDKSLKQTLKLIESTKYSVSSNYYSLQIVYLDGTKKDVTLAEKNIAAVLERQDNVSIIEVIPKEVAASASEVQFKDNNYNIIKDDPIISFTSDTKQVIYQFNKQVDFDKLKLTKLVLLSIVEDTGNNVGSGITGFFSFNTIGQEGFAGIFVGIIILVVLLIYFFYLRKNRKSNHNFHKISKDLQLALHCLKKGKVRKSEKIYNSLKEQYKDLSLKEKSLIFYKIDSLRNKILVYDFEKGLERLNETRDKELLNELDKLYHNMSPKYKNGVYPFFNKMKKDFSNEN